MGQDGTIADVGTHGVGAPDPLGNLSAVDALAYVSDLVLVVDADGAVSGATGPSQLAAALVGRPLAQVIHPADLADLELSLALDAPLRRSVLRIGLPGSSEPMAVVALPAHGAVGGWVLSCTKAGASDDLVKQLVADHRVSRLQAGVARVLTGPRPGRLAERVALALAELRTELAADRAYAFQLLAEERLVEPIGESYDAAVPPIPRRGQRWKFDDTPALVDAILKGQVVMARGRREPGHWAAEAANMERAGISAAMVVPMVVEHEVIGMLGVESRTEERTWTAEEVRLVTAVADMIGPAHALHDELEQHLIAFERSPAPTALYRPDGTFVGCNPAWNRLFRRAPHELERIRLIDLVHPADRRHAGEGIQEITAGRAEDHEFESRFLRADGDVRLLRTRGNVLMSSRDRVRLVVVHAEDVTEDHRLRSDLERRATHDALTDLANRPLFEEHLETVVERNRRTGRGTAVLFLDVDGFKAVNDAWGHASGDEVLRTLAHRLVGAVRPSDLVARLGGDEFAVVVGDVDDDKSVVALAERLRSRLSTPVEMHGEVLGTSTSIGVAISRDPTLAPAEIVRRADEAMYRAKSLGRDRCEVWTS